ncbi:FAD-binding oxidoreductase [Candidatus Methylobacter oryzae]|uniref:FAD-binding oxidoreductase n=1 Tax=Candidatus Methylobacter oryzae TaxID=2497749 RepID=A0ABY3CG44_9GAMM|nr:FAD-binding oxidoreductase [Candidatus Methylobacter oryzae]TRX01766.1 FAD-binding oxidoreductase [Candidatus Methylobacter oryzae]
MVTVSSWGRLNSSEHKVRRLFDRHRIVQQLQGRQTGIAYGMGRSYGDVCLNPHGILWNTAQLDRFIHFDANTGRLTCEAGVLLSDIQQLAIPQGWALPVTPGTRFVTVGGAIANDVHGKNHHACGSFGNHIRRLKLIRTDGTVIDCGPNFRPDWFAATIGGFGLTGVIAEAEIQLKQADSSWLEVEVLPYDRLDDFFDLADSSHTDWEYSAAWIDCLSAKNTRGVFMRANPASAAVNQPPPRNRRLSIPFTPPLSLINRLTLPLFNSAYFHINKRRTGRHLAHYQNFFYPLDTVQGWNRLYGPSGFFQYQSVVPCRWAHDAITAMLAETARYGDGSFLAVLKTFGRISAAGIMSFPQEGVTLTLDFANRGSATQRLFKRLDAIVHAADGRLYLAKDARMPRDLFGSGYPRLAEFLRYRDPGISSALSRRLIGM